LSVAEAKILTVCAVVYVVPEAGLMIETAGGVTSGKGAAEARELHNATRSKSIGIRYLLFITLPPIFYRSPTPYFYLCLQERYRNNRAIY
jgi:hypothetical protein